MFLNDHVVIASEHKCFLLQFAFVEFLWSDYQNMTFVYHHWRPDTLLAGKVRNGFSSNRSRTQLIDMNLESVRILPTLLIQHVADIILANQIEALIAMPITNNDCEFCIFYVSSLDFSRILIAFVCKVCQRFCIKILWHLNEFIRYKLPGDTNA